MCLIFKGPVDFSTETTVLGSHCVELPSQEGSDAPSVCEGLGQFKIYRYYNYYGGMILRVQDEGYEVTMLPEECGDNQVYGTTALWRLANGVPYAVVVQVTCFTSNDQSAFEDIAGSFYVVRGLTSTPGIAMDVPISAQTSMDMIFSKTDAAYLQSIKE